MKTIPGIILMLVALWANAHPSVSLIMDSRGNVYYSDLKHVWKIDVHGKKTVVVHNVHTHELYLDKDDNLFGEHLWYNGETANTWGHYIWKLTINGTLEQIKPPTIAFVILSSLFFLMSFWQVFVRSAQYIRPWSSCTKL